MTNQFAQYYNAKIREMWNVTYGGSIRALKGTLVETLCENMVKQAWQNIKGGSARISVDRRIYYITDESGNRYGIAQDKQVYIDNSFRLSIECKAYAEVAMYKRIIVDCLLLKRKFPDLKFCLFQLESMLGGDYAEHPAHPRGSPSVKVLDYVFPDLNIEILTLLDGGRNIKREIHKQEFYKPLRPERLEYALDYFERTLSPYV